MSAKGLSTLRTVPALHASIICVEFFQEQIIWAEIGCQLGEERRKNKIMSLRVGAASQRNILGLCRQQDMGFVVPLTSCLCMEVYSGSHKSSMQLGLGKGIE